MQKICLGIAGLLLGAVQAHAADLGIIPAPPMAPAPVPAFTWSGLHIGGNVGAAWGKFVHDDVYAAYAGGGVGPAANALFGASTNRKSAVIGGGQIGYDWQFGQFVLGVEGDLQRTRIDHGLVAAPAGFDPFLAGADSFGAVSRWMASARARAGVAWDRFMLYGTAGGAWASADVSACYMTRPAPGSAGACVSDSRTLSGWTAGLGVEYAYTDSISFGLEYRHTHLGSAAFNLGGFTDAAGHAYAVGSHTRLTTGEVLAKVNFKFDGLFVAP